MVTLSVRPLCKLQPFFFFFQMWGQGKGLDSIPSDYMPQLEVTSQL